MRHLLAVLAVMFCTASAQAQPQEPLVHASLIADAGTLEAGKPIWVALAMDVADDWHVYWQNPGDSGIPTEITWQLPEGATASAIHWPLPQRQPSSGLVNYGYSHRVVLPVAITLADADDVTLKAKASWLVCKDICIPESAELSIDLPSTEGADDIAAALARVPAIHAGDNPLTYTRDGDNVRIRAPRSIITDADISGVSIFPLTDGIIQNAAEQVVDITDDAIIITVAANPAAVEKGTLEGVIAYSVNGEQRALHLRNAQEEAVPAAISKPAAEPVVTIGFAAALLFAFAGGMLLNLMPCVLPIVALKAFSIAGKSGAERGVVVRQGIFYTLGVLVSMAVLGAALYALTSAGAAVGWGFQLQSPYVVATLVVLMVLVAMHLFNWFHLPNLLTNTDQHLGNKKGATGSFFTGALSVAVATPCTAPFMAPALGAAALLPPLQGLLILLALGLGLAFPYLLMCLWPAARRILPKPGVWMEHFKQFLAFPMLATAVWLVWVLAQLNGEAGVGTVLAGMVLLAFGIWWLRGAHHIIKRIVAWVVIAAALWVAIGTQPPVAARAPVGETVINGVNHVPYSEDALADLRGQNKPVLVDATAAWCITCKINERVALRDGDVEKYFSEHGITVMVADWTMRDDAITAYLASFGRNGVPLYVWYAPGKDGVVLPQVLTPEGVLAAVQH